MGGAPGTGDCFCRYTLTGEQLLFSSLTSLDKLSLELVPVPKGTAAVQLYVRFRIDSRAELLALCERVCYNQASEADAIASGEVLSCPCST